MLSPAEIANDVSSGLKHKATMPLLSVVIMSVMAGGSIGMGDIFWAHATVGVETPGIANFIGGFAFSVGLMMVVFFGGHLFTSSVMSGVSTYDKKLSFAKMISYWVIVWIFNFVGSALIAYMYFRSELPLKYGGEILMHFLHLGAGKTALGVEPAFIRGIFCNVFVCMAVWAAMGAKDTAGKVLAIAFIIAAFVASGYEHCVANMFIISMGLLAKAYYLVQVHGDIDALAALSHISVAKLSTLNISGFFHNLAPVTAGNIVGGVFFVGILGFIANKPDFKPKDV
ncbi:formate/nitrite transporter family protein [Sulfurospirillum sp. 1612]|uniref:formate/nitrite transporter family protein n=1 Tax=Sulfurospirillum sp. 1612 TaxID=3094835 RepID=UPI002F954056